MRCYEVLFFDREILPRLWQCSEIEKKPNRPYTIALVNCNNFLFAIPLRSNIKHPNVVWSDFSNRCGLDLSKAVIIKDKDLYIDNDTEVIIRQNEFDELRGREFFLQQKMQSYIKKYIKALSNLNEERNRKMCKFSTLQYFHNELKIDKLLNDL